jgi:hypothetical protein
MIAVCLLSLLLTIMLAMYFILQEQRDVGRYCDNVSNAYSIVKEMGAPYVPISKGATLVSDK